MDLVGPPSSSRWGLRCRIRRFGPGAGGHEDGGQEEKAHWPPWNGPTVPLSHPVKMRGPMMQPPAVGSSRRNASDDGDSRSTRSTKFGGVRARGRSRGRAVVPRCSGAVVRIGVPSPCWYRRNVVFQKKQPLLTPSVAVLFAHGRRGAPAPYLTLHHCAGRLTCALGKHSGFPTTYLLRTQSIHTVVPSICASAVPPTNNPASPAVYGLGASSTPTHHHHHDALSPFQCPDRVHNKNKL